jgi:nucleoside-diphosphate-sugar epimerase
MPNRHPLKKVGITGGAGFLGINLTRYLLGKGVEVVSFDKSPFDYPEKARITTHTGDIRDGDAVRDALTGCNAVVHAAAALPLYPKEEILSVDIEGTRTVVDATKNLGISRFVHISSTAVYGVPDHHPLHEDDPLIGVGPYGTAKIEAERVVEGFRDDLLATILRPKSFIGPERLGVFALLFDWASTGHHFPIPGRGTNLYQYLDVEDLCEAIWLSLTAPKKVANDTYNIGAERFGTFAGDFQEVLDHAGFGKRVKSLPAMPAVWILRLLDKVKLSPLYPWVYETAVKDSFVSINKAQTHLGFQPRYSNAESLIRNYDWYVANADSFQGTSGVSHRVPWKQGALALAKVFFR